MRYLMDSSAYLYLTHAGQAANGTPFPQMPFLPFYDTVCVAVCKTASVTPSDGGKLIRKAILNPSFC